MDSMDRNPKQGNEGQAASDRSRQRTLSEFLKPRPSGATLDTQLDDSVLLMQEGQEPWPNAQAMDSYISTQQNGFRDSVVPSGSLLDTPAHDC